MEQRPWEAHSRSSSQEVLVLLWNPKVHCCVHKSLPLVHMLSPYFIKIHINVFLTSVPKSSNDLFLSGFLIKMLYTFPLLNLVILKYFI
jgi:hypothetical protein